MREYIVMRDQREIFYLRLRQEKTIEWVPMRLRESRDRCRVDWRDRQTCKAKFIGKPQE